MSDERLRNIEDKLDRLAEAITRLAVVDERLTNLIEANSRTAERTASNEKKIGELETTAATQALLLSRIEKLLWIGGTGVATALWQVFFGG